MRKHGRYAGLGFVLFALGIASLVFGRPICAQTRYMGEGYFETAMDKYVQKLYDEAIPLYRKFLEIAPNDFQGRYFLARCLDHTGNTAEALKTYAHALRISSEDYDAHYYLGSLLFKTGEDKRALEHFQAAHRSMPALGSAVVQMGNVHRARKEYEKAGEYYRQALALEPEQPESRIALAVLRRDQGDPGGARKDLEAVVKKWKDSSPAYYELGNTLAAIGDIDGALRSFRTATELRPRYAEAYNRIGEILLGRGDPNGAREAFTKALNANPWFVPAAENLKKAGESR